MTRGQKMRGKIRAKKNIYISVPSAGLDVSGPAGRDHVWICAMRPAAHPRHSLTLNPHEFKVIYELFLLLVEWLSRCRE